MNDDNKNEIKSTKNTESVTDVAGGTLRRIYRIYYAEFKKIVWPSRPTLIKHTLTVIIVSLIFGAYIALTDGILTVLFGRFVGLVS